MKKCAKIALGLAAVAACGYAFWKIVIKPEMNDDSDDDVFDDDDLDSFEDDDLDDLDDESKDEDEKKPYDSVKADKASKGNSKGDGYESLTEKDIFGEVPKDNVE